MKTSPALAEYLEQVTGVPAAVRDLPLSEAERIPLFLRSAYDLYEATLFTRRFIFAVERDGQSDATPGEYAKHDALLRNALGSEVAVVLARAPTYVRNRLVRQGVPFVVPGRQMFLPFLAVDLREREPRAVRAHREVVSAAAQALLLRHLLEHSMEGRQLKDVASDLGYSAMTVTNVADELETLGLCKVVRHGRIRHLAFEAGGFELWKRASVHMNSPVRARRWVHRLKKGQVRMLAAGMTALERYTDIADDQVPTFALWQNEYRSRLEHGDLSGCENADDAEAAVECWAYDPLRLTRGDCVDRLSLYLSLRGSSDERVQKELKKLIGEMKW